MSNAQRGLLNLTKLNKAAKAGHSAFFRNKDNNEILVNITGWVNDQPDEFGNIMAVHLNPKKDAPDNNKAGKVYIANFKPGNVPVEAGAKDIPNDDDLPFWENLSEGESPV